MSNRLNRRTVILDAAAQLFVSRGYDATSVRQIADEVGCTEAALYYHFKDGKRELFREVVECNMPSLFQVVECCRDAQSLQELAKRFGEQMCLLTPLRADRLRWIIAEFPLLSETERASFHAKYLHFHSELAGLIEQFVDSRAQAESLAWLLMSTYLGYAQLFINQDLQSVSDFSGGQLNTLLSSLIEAFYPEQPLPDESETIDVEPPTSL
ncbi:MAG: TetR/AcrR family transcriptional regulator [Anaerolineae bacterium]|nr:TetR/AcrR family transcriptional regulator [Anaerolineae bacterium]